MPHKCTLCEIIEKNLKSYIVYENDFFIALLDIKPLFIGHCLLAPKRHVQTIYDLPSEIGINLLQTVQLVGNAITNAMSAQGSFIAINNKVSQSIDHLHVHIVPRNKGDGLKGFFWPRSKYQSDTHLQEAQAAIKKAIEKIKTSN